MAELKTKETKQNVEEFLNQLENEKKREDSFAILELMKKASKKEPKMWGPSIIGFGQIPYIYPDGREMDWFYFGFSPRKQNFVLYFPQEYEGFGELLKKLGKIKTGKSCIYFNKIEDIDQSTFKEMVKRSVVHLDQKRAQKNV
jgi:hypothetical protein